MIRLPRLRSLHLQPMSSQELQGCRFFFHWLTKGLPSRIATQFRSHGPTADSTETFMANNNNRAFSSEPRGDCMKDVSLTTGAPDTLGSPSAPGPDTTNTDQSVGCNNNLTTHSEIEESDSQAFPADRVVRIQLCTTALDLSCPCPVCTLKGSNDYYNKYRGSLYPRHWPCGLIFHGNNSSLYCTKQHVKDHYHWNGKFHCNAPDCKAAFKSMADLSRHSSKHCTNPVMHSCEKPGCDRIGDNGFTRKGKLRDHIRQKHKGFAGIPKSMRRLEPRVPVTEGEGKGKEKATF